MTPELRQRLNRQKSLGHYRAPEALNEALNRALDIMDRLTDSCPGLEDGIESVLYLLETFDAHHPPKDSYYAYF